MAENKYSFPEITFRAFPEKLDLNDDKWIEDILYNKGEFEKICNYITNNSDVAISNNIPPQIKLLIYTVKNWFDKIAKIAENHDNEGLLEQAYSNLLKTIEVLNKKAWVENFLQLNSFVKKKQKQINVLVEDFEFIISDSLIIGSCSYLVGQFGIFMLAYNHNTSTKYNVINLTNKQNGYHIFPDGRFCDKTTIDNLAPYIIKNDYTTWFLSLSTIFSSYDDTYHDLAHTEDFIIWKRFFANILINWKTYTTKQMLTDLEEITSNIPIKAKKFIANLESHKFFPTNKDEKTNIIKKIYDKVKDIYFDIFDKFEEVVENNNCKLSEKDREYLNKLKDIQW